MNEIWLPDIQTNGKYEVSNFGQIRNATTKRISKLNTNSNHGYPTYAARMNGTVKRLLVHRAVALAFIPNPERKGFVNHKDGTRTNNHLDNLEWVTPSENNLHCFRQLERYNHPMKAVAMLDNDLKVIATFRSTRQAESITGIHSGSIVRSCNHPTMKAGGYLWKYL